MSEEKCKNCGGWYGLHHYETLQCPPGGIEQPINRPQRWLSTTFARDDSAELASLRPAAAERDELKRRLSDLLAAINRDGGHAEQEDPDCYQHALSHVAELHQHLDGLHDSLANWAALWAHICKRLGADADTLPNETNFDSMIEAVQSVIEQRDQLRSDFIEAQDVIAKWQRDYSDLKRHLDAIYADLASATGYAYAPGADFDVHEAVMQLINQLNNQRQSLQNYETAFSESLETIKKQAAQLEQAREIMSMRRDSSEIVFEQQKLMSAWLAANAPKMCEVCEDRPASVERDGHYFCGYCYGSYAAITYGEEFAQMPAPKSEGETHFDSAQKYREALEQIERVWVGESVADEHLAALKMYTISARALNNADEEKDQAVTA